VDFQGQFFLFCLFGFWGRVGRGVGGVGYVFFFLSSNNSVLSAVLLFLQKKFVLDRRVQGL
jgi:hypothetical protein